jgi:hypothetical protein
MKPSTGWPFISRMQVGMLRMPNAWASCCSWSESILTSLKRPAYSASSFSSIGPITLQGPHQGAQKSTSTGWVMEAAMTSASKFSSVTSIMAWDCAP